MWQRFKTQETRINEFLVLFQVFWFWARICKSIYWFCFHFLILVHFACWSVSCSIVSDSFLTPWAIAHQAPLSMGFSRQKYWNWLPLPSPGSLLDTGIEPGSPALQADSLPSQPPQSLLLWKKTHYSWRKRSCGRRSQTISNVPHPGKLPAKELPSWALSKLEWWER